MEINKKTQGKKNRAAGVRFELRVRKDLQEKGWIVSKWMNNVCVHSSTAEHLSCKQEVVGSNPAGHLIPAKHKFRGPGIPMSIGTGFPDFIAFVTDRNEIIKEYELPFMDLEVEKINHDFRANIIGVESKMNGILDKIEKEKCKWILENNIFSKILIASKGTKRGQIVYKEF